jgi:hypothetical protein
VALAIVYALTSPRMETFVPRLILLAALAGAARVLCLAVLRFGRVSSQAIAAVVSCAIGLVALYVAWVVWLWWFFRHVVQLRISPLNLVLHPLVMFRVMRHVNQTGTWMYQGEPLNGLTLTIIWLVEAATVLAAAVLIGLRATDRRAPTCPDCRVPCKYVRGMPRLAADRADEVPAIAEAQVFSQLLSFGPLVRDDDPEVNFHLYTCPRCGLTNVLSAYHTAWTMHSAVQRPVVKSRTLVDRMLIGPQHVEQLKDVKRQIDEQKSAAEDHSQPEPPSMSESAG